MGGSSKVREIEDDDSGSREAEAPVGHLCVSDPRVVGGSIGSDHSSHGSDPRGEGQDEVNGNKQ